MEHKTCEKEQIKRREAEEEKTNLLEKLIPRNHYESISTSSGIPIFFRDFDFTTLSISENYPKSDYEEKFRKRGLHSETRTRGRETGNAIDTLKVSLV